MKDDDRMDNGTAGLGAMKSLVAEAVSVQIQRGSCPTSGYSNVEAVLGMALALLTQIMGRDKV